MAACLICSSAVALEMHVLPRALAYVLALPLTSARVGNAFSQYAQNLAATLVGLA